MKTPFALYFWAIAAVACNGNRAQGVTSDADSVSIDSVPEKIVYLPDTSYASVDNVKYRIDIEDSTEALLCDFRDLYAEQRNICLFRRNLLRNADFGGSVKGIPSEIEESWVFQTDVDNTATNFGSWGGGTGWTGQPLYIQWTDADTAAFRRQSPGLTDDFGTEEIYVSSLCGRGYFINFKTGRASRRPLDLANVVKGTSSLDPEYKNLYVGQGVPRTAGPFGCEVFDLLRHERTFFFGPDRQAWRGWGAFDSNAVVAGGFLFWPGENGSLYKYRRSQGQLNRVAVLRYRVRGSAPGIESSLCIYKNYGYFADNHGNVICVNLNTLRPVWHYRNLDDTDGTIVCREEGGLPFVYTACEVDKQGTSGTCHFVKLNGLNGELAWEQNIPCRRIELPGKTLDGGMYATPLLGLGDCKEMIFANICRNGAARHAGEMVALDTKTGEIRYTVPYSNFAWSSPIPLTNERGEMFVFTGDASGNAYVIRGATGEILCRRAVGFNFESSPIAVGNAVVVGCRGRNIYKFLIR